MGNLSKFHILEAAIWTSIALVFLFFHLNSIKALRFINLAQLAGPAPLF